MGILGSILGEMKIQMKSQLGRAIRDIQKQAPDESAPPEASALPTSAAAPASPEQPPAQ